MTWLLLAFLSAMLLGFYDVSKKKALQENTVVPVLFLNTLFCSLNGACFDGCQGQAERVCLEA